MIITLLIACTLAVLVRWAVYRYVLPQGPVWVHQWIMLFVFGFILLYKNLL